ncbi:unnamed protein product [Clonostachys byssicola]|uniref:tRNA wybutosine-synthesizing protein 4 n=1 Tax=Clonostachys byssicola TaxID=160290 RepID=A0A9N9U5P3_9HYPO|nr:unnamed protein product [Clonostachys byssicola]
MPDSKGSAKLARSKALDDLIMGTNSSSIVSKRSVERLYYANESHYFRHFVRKPQRRAPLINRGYWLRLKAIDVIVRQFLRSTPSKRVVINLGCGSDVLPWQCHTRYGPSCQDAVFIDVDYPDLMRKKRTIVLETPELRGILGSDFKTSQVEGDPVLLKSDKYCQLACDLRDLKGFQQTLESLLPLSECSVLFVAEVSITYMDTESADALIQWASSIGKAEFCLLEQILPNGPNHPFAQTMLKHFNKLNTPLKSVHQYPTVASQSARFKHRGWQQVDIWDLWNAWVDDKFVTSTERVSLDDIEPFDEWEEFLLFCRHYVVVHAQAAGSGMSRSFEEIEPSRSLDVQIKKQIPSATIKRRFGNSLVLQNPESGHVAVHMLGLGNEARSDTYDLFNIGNQSAPSSRLPFHGPFPRMCSTMSDLDEFGILLAGGRTNPTKALSECWLLTRGASCSWRKTWELPKPLYRHAALRLKNSSLVLVVGGKTGPSEISDDVFVFHPERGWLTCEKLGIQPEPLFGATICNSFQAGVERNEFGGLLAGGLRRDGTFNHKQYRWSLKMSTSQPLISFEEVAFHGNCGKQLAVFGATIVDLGRRVAICGGMGETPSHQGQTILLLSGEDTMPDILALKPPTDKENDWPLMIGSSTVFKDGQISVIGGGATCFSMGTYWETAVYHLRPPVDNSLLAESTDVTLIGSEALQSWEYMESPKILGKTGNDPSATSNQEAVITTEIPRVILRSAAEFDAIVRKGKPVVMERLDLGPCVQTWTAEHMAELVGAEREFVVHESRTDTERLDFNSKNFQYVTDSFGNIMKRIQQGGRLYLRALSNSKPSERPANIKEDFPALADDFIIPKEVALVEENLFSSILRVSGKVNMWLHYDVMANIYAQVRGSKRMILFPPSDVSSLSFAPGSSSSSIDVFSLLASSSLPKTSPYETNLAAGDVLFIPTAWLHTATPTSDMSVAVNVFFRDLDKSSYSAGRDVYGNRDLAAYERGRQDIAKLGKSFENLPQEVRRFYLARLADELLQTGEAAHE